MADENVENTGTSEVPTTTQETEPIEIGDSILLTVKKMLSLTPENTDFDADILIHINSVLAILQQLDIGPEDGYFITDAEATWADYLGNDSTHVNMVKSYMAAKVRLLFDPPVSSAVMDSLNRICSEFEWRANVAAENYKLDKEATGNESDSDNP